MQVGDCRAVYLLGYMSNDVQQSKLANRVCSRRRFDNRCILHAHVIVNARRRLLTPPPRLLLLLLLLVIVVVMVVVMVMQLLLRLIPHYFCHVLIVSVTICGVVVSNILLYL